MVQTLESGLVAFVHVLCDDVNPVRPLLSVIARRNCCSIISWNSRCADTILNDSWVPFDAELGEGRLEPQIHKEATLCGLPLECIEREINIRFFRRRYEAWCDTCVASFVVVKPYIFVVL